MRCCSLGFVKKYYIACVNRGLDCEVPLRNTLLHKGESYVWKQQQLVVGISKHFGMYLYTYIMIWIILDKQCPILSENSYISVLQNVQTGRGPHYPPSSLLFNG
jgi:hypothetical protein